MARARETALTAPAARTGFDARRDANGKTVSIEETAKAYARTCKR